MAAYTRRLRCAGAPRRPASGSGLSLTIPAWHAVLHDPGEFEHRHGPVLRCRHGLRRDLSGSALPKFPQSASSRARLSRLPGLLTLRPARLLAPLRRIEPASRPQRAFTSRLPADWSPALPLDMTTTWSGLLVLAGLSPAGMAASLAAPDPYWRDSRIRLLPRVSDGEPLAWPQMKDLRLGEELVGQFRHPRPCQSRSLTAPAQPTMPEGDDMISEVFVGKPHGERRRALREDRWIQFRRSRRAKPRTSVLPLQCGR